MRAVKRHLPEILSALGLHLDAPQDADRFSRAFGELEFAISELLTERKLGPDLRGVFEAVDRHSRRDMERVLALDVAGDLPDAMVGDFVRRNVELIRTAGLGQLSEVRDLILQATQFQVSREDLEAELQSRYDVTKARANLIARDQVLKQNADLGQVRMKLAGVRKYVWSTAQDERVRGTPGGKWPKGTHYSLNGTVQTWDNPPIVDARKGRREHPGKDYQCRCVAIPVVDDLLYEGLGPDF